MSEAALWRALGVFRLLALFYAASLLAISRNEYGRPVLAGVVVALMAGWTVAVVLLYERPAGRRWTVLVVDLAVAMAAVVATRFVDTSERLTTDALTLPTFWAAAPVLAWAIGRGPVAGAVAALCIGVADVVERGRLTLPTAHNVVLLLLLGTIIGYAVVLVRRGERALAEAARADAATRERERLARDIHDGVLQVLALAARRGAEAGGEAAELGRLAGEQEAALRALVTSHRDPVPDAGEVDLRDELAAYASSGMSISQPGTPVLLPAATAREVVAALGAALDNVRAHAPGASTWLLVEDEDDEVVLSLRDDGPGFAPGRLETAEAEGRIGVARSLRGRLAELGGSATVTSRPGAGTEVELRVPRRVRA